MRLSLAACIGGLLMSTGNAAAANVKPPQGVTCYLDAVNARNLSALTDCFAPNGVVVDVSRRIAGKDAISAWAKAEVIGGKIELLSIEADANGVYRCLVHWAPAGSSGWRARYTFTLRDGRIVLADLQYA
jgi:hypothetical protein